MDREHVLLGDYHHFIKLAIPPLNGEDEVVCVVAVQSGHYSVQNAELYIPLLAIQQWYQGLKQMHRELKGTVVLTNWDNSLFLKVTTRTLGQLHVEGTIQELPSVENQLTFEFQLDQSYLPRVIEGLKKVVNK